MVSTRGVKFKFSEGEKVLCYEPDPTKAKVLYDSKVLELNVSRDNRGRKVSEYLIHFYGWSSSWDRWVKEEFILPETEENQNLQIRLAKDAALSLKCRNKVKLPPNIKETLSKTPDDSQEVKEPSVIPKIEAVDSSSASESSDSETEHTVELELPQALKDVLDDDWLMITQKDKVFKIPCEMNVISILEKYVKHLATELLEACESKNAKPDKETVIQNAEDKINLCKEVLDGVRVYFDFTLPHLLLYRQEKKQFYTVGNTCSVAVKSKNSVEPLLVPKEEPRAPVQSPTRSGLRNQSSTRKLSTSNDEEPADASPKPRQRVKKMRTIGPRRSLRSSDKSKIADDETNDNTEGSAAIAAESSQSSPRPDSPLIPTSPSKQSLRSAHTAAAPPNNTKSSTSQKKLSHSSSSNQTTNAASISNNNASTLPVVKTENVLPSQDTNVLNDIQAWRMVPPSLYNQVPAAPSLVYGGQHLLRLFVKLPELIMKSQVRQTYMETIMTILKNFLNYLVDKKEEIFLPSYIDSSEGSADVSGLLNP